MKILWFTWKDIKNPLAGGAEVINNELASRLVKDNHEVIMIVSNFSNNITEEIYKGYKIVRVGNRYTVYWHAYRYYKKYLIGWPDLVIDEVNTIPFFCKYYVKVPNILFVYQLCREIWFYEMPFPFNLIGYLLEPIILWFLNDRKVITESDSTKRDMIKYGFKSKNINIIPIGIGIEPLQNIFLSKKFSSPTLLSLGSIRSMKRTFDQVTAFEIAKIQIPELKLIVAGYADNKYGKKILKMIKKSRFSLDIQYLGIIDENEKINIMRKSHLILVTSVKEGWGLIVTEANSQGTPAIVYNVDGLRDSVRHNDTGIITKENNPKSMADAIVDLFNNKSEYERLRVNAWNWSHEMTFQKCYKNFLEKAEIR